MRRPDLDDLRAGVWTLRGVVRCRRQIGRRDLHEITLPVSEGISPRAGRVVVRLLSRRRDQCLSNALIVQAWRADHGDPVDVVIGVKSPSAGFTAHAWLADSADALSGEHQPIHHLAPRPARSRVR